MVGSQGSPAQLPRVVAAAITSGVDWLQIRERVLEGRELLRFAEELSQAGRNAARASGRNLAVLINRRVDLALAIGADGIHLGFDAMSPGDARTLLAQALDAPEIGVSAHAPGEVETAAREGATYAHLAPIFDPISKAAERPALGVRELGRTGSLPVLAQGGLTPERCRAVLEAGAAGIAVTGAILGAEDPDRATRALRRALDGLD